MSGHERWMRRALELAARGRGLTSPNPMVGAVLVKNGKLVAEGYHRRCGTAHAETIALRKAGGRAAGSTLFVNLEPCAHHGRTPPCVDAVIASGVHEVVVAMKDPNPATNGRSIRKLRRAGIKVSVGCLRKEAMALNEIFIKHVTEGLPFVVTKTAQTLDGKIATAGGVSKWITTAAARQSARQQRDHYDAILVGIETVLKDDPLLTGGKDQGKFLRIILDNRLRIPLKAKLFQAMPSAQCVVATLTGAPARKKALLQKIGVEVMECPARKGMIDLRVLLKRLARRPVTSVLIEGGGAVVGNALAQGLVDKMHIYVSPRIMGDANALDAIRGLAVQKLDDMVRLRDLTIETINEDLFLSGYVHRNH